MIAYVKGIVAMKDAQSVVVDVNSIGYRVYLSGRDLDRLPPLGESVFLHTYFQVREDAMQLFGFLKPDDLEMYRLLLGVNGIGPKAALGVLSALTADDLRFAVLSGDEKTISKAPGIGRKTAQKLILELKDKINLEEAFEKKLSGEELPAGESASSNEAKSEAVQALIALGYSNTDALRAVNRAASEDMDTEEILKAALKNMTF